MFFEELTLLLEIVAAYRCEIVICGDFNLHVNKAADHHARRFGEILASFDLVQAVDQPTHGDGNTLDLVITRRDTEPINCAVQPPNIISDHSLVTCRFSSMSLAANRNTVTMRPWKKLDMAAFITSLRSSALCEDTDTLQQMSADELCDVYDDTLRRIVDQHVPSYTATIRDRRLSPWFDDDCRASRRRSRMLERRYRRTLTADDRLTWIRQVRTMHALYEQKQNHYWSHRISEHSGDSKKLWRSLSSVLARDRRISQASPDVTADKLAKFFVEKVDGVRADTRDAPPPSFTSYDGPQLRCFREVSMDDVRRVLMRSPVKSCALDPLPTFILREVIDVVLPFIWVLCNVSLSTGCLPESQKKAIVTPALKKWDADPDELRNYRPISNLTFLSKVIERLVVEQMTHHLNDRNLMPKLQSAYRRHHSTETALVKVLSDILDAADSRQVTLLGLLDMSAAFDTVDHDILLQRLEISFGFSNLALEWIRSFVTGRQQTVTFRGVLSAYLPVLYGVPQGSVLGPLLFVLYAADVTTIANMHNVRVHAYADDTQLYNSCSAADGATSADQLLCCMSDIGRWMSSNRLKLNVDKTQFIWIGAPRQLQEVSNVQLMVDGVPVPTADTVKDLGVTLDAQLSFKNHVDSVVRSCYYQIRQLRSIRRCVPADAMRTLVHAFVTSRIDYCNAVLYGVTATVTRRLQAVLHAAARLITGVRRNEHITSTIRDTLHWLPVSQRITFKVALMTFDCVRGQGPDYLNDILVPVHSVGPRARLRSADHGDMVVPRTQTSRYGPRSIRSSAPSVWNDLPSQLKDNNLTRLQFKTGLKTWLFERAYF